MADEVFDIDATAFNRGLELLRRIVPKETNVLLKQVAGNFVKKVVSITPPAGGGRTGLDARRAGERSIDRDLDAVFEGRPRIGRRQVKKVFGHTPKSPIFVKTKVLYPDVKKIYEERARKDFYGRKVMTRGQRAAYYVDIYQLDALRKSLKKRVGFLAAGWNAAAEALGVKLPAWIRKIGTAFGMIIMDLKEDEGLSRISIIHAVEWNLNVEGFERRIQSALDMQAGAMNRQADYLIEKAARSSGF
jgi:hypothetical protein